MSVELLCVGESTRLLRRDFKKYYKDVSSLYLFSLISPKNGKLTRVSYMFFRHLDDVVDGDYVLTIDPVDYVNSVRHQVESDSFNGSPTISHLAHYALQKLKEKARESDNPRQDFLDSIDALLFDYGRTKNRRVMSSTELNDYYLTRFSPFMNIFLTGVDSKFRARDIPKFCSSIGVVYSASDLGADWGRGVINVPKEVLDSAGLTSDSEVTSVKESPVINRWFTDGLQESKAGLLEVRNKLRGASEAIPSLACSRIIKENDRMLERIKSSLT